MSEREYKPNSYAYKERQKNAQEEKRIEKVARGNVKTKKKSDLYRLADVFIAEDVRSVKNYALMEIIIPAVKKALYDVICDSTGMILGEGKRDTRRGDNSSYVSYRSYSDDRSRRRTDEIRYNNNFDREDIVYESKGEAEAVLERMDACLDQYGVVKVADMYDAAGLTAPFTANKYGWTSLRNAETVRVRDGYIIKLPKAMPLD